MMKFIVKFIDDEILILKNYFKKFLIY